MGLTFTIIYDNIVAESWFVEKKGEAMWRSVKAILRCAWKVFVLCLVVALGFVAVAGVYFVSALVQYPWLVWGGSVIVLAVLLLRGAIVIPTVNYGVVLRFKKRTGRVLDEGLNFILPFVDSAELFKYEIVTTPIEESFFSRDNLQIIIKGSVQWSPDKKLLKSVFIERSEEAIKEGLVAAIKSELGIIAGTKPGSAFIKSREAISLLINSVLRMQTPPHLDPLLGIELSKRLKYYEDHSIGVRFHLREEHRMTEDRSDLEERYGIDVLEFALADVDFSPETKKQMELAKQTEAKLKADELEAKKKIDLVDRFKTMGLDPQAANNAAEVLMDQADRRIFSLEGLDKLKF